MQLWVFVLLLGFMVHFLLILGTARLCGSLPSVWMAVAGGVLHGLHAGLCLIPGFSFLGNEMWRILFLLLTCFVAFYQEEHWMRLSAVYLLLQLSLGEITRGEWWHFLMGAGLICLLCSIGMGPGEPGQQYCRVSISHGGKTAELIALLDTGNTLRDPVTGKQVIVVDGNLAELFWGCSVDCLQKPVETLMFCKGLSLRLIPYSTVGKPAGLLLGFQPDRICFDGVPKDRIVAFAPHKIGCKSTFQALAGGIV